MDKDRLGELQQCKKVGDMDPYTVLEVHSGKLVDSVHGRVIIALVTYIASDKSTFRGRMMMPPRVVPELDGKKVDEEIPPMLMVYLGKKELEKEGHSCFDIRTVTVPKEKTIAEYAQELRLMSHESLSTQFKISSFGDFPEGSVFICESVRQLKQTSKDEIGLSKETRVPVMRYETTHDGVVKTGEIFLPHRTYSEAKKNLPAVLLYNGLRKSKKGGRSYFDITVMDETITSTLLDVSPDNSARSNPPPPPAADKTQTGSNSAFTNDGHADDTISIPDSDEDFFPSESFASQSIPF